MQKTFLALLIAILTAGTVSAQRRELNMEQEWRWEQKRKLANTGFMNISYATQKMIEPESGLELGKSDFGAAITKGRTYTMHHRPIAEMIYIGLDAVWTDVNYARYKNMAGLETETKMHQIDISMGIGPSVHLLPIKKLGIHAYFRYMPTLATYFGNISDGVMGGYASVFTTGAAVSWSAISLGAEARWGTGKYKMYGGDDEGIESDGKLKTSGMRAYVSFRF